MSNKLLMWLFRKRLKKLSPEDKQCVCELVNETKSDTTEKTQNKKTKKRRNKKMADEKEVKKEEVKTEEKVEENKKDEATKPVAEDKVETEEKKEVETEETETADKVEPTEQVAEIEPEGNGRSIDDYMLKDDVMALISALNAKIDAVVKENSDLKDAKAKADSEAEDLRNKYEKGDFGTNQKQGVMAKDKTANEDFESYSKQFM